MRAPLRELEDWKVTDQDEDIRGWTLRSPDGRPLGAIRELIADTETQCVETVVLDDGAEYRVADLEIGDGEVHLASRGPESRTTGATNASATKGDRKVLRIPVVEERVEVGKREVTTGGVRVRTNVTESPVEETVTLKDTNVHVSRREADRPATPEDLQAATNDIEVVATHEEPVVSKTARVTGEVVVSKDVAERQETVKDTARKTNVDANKLNDPKGDKSGR